MNRAPTFFGGKCATRNVPQNSTTSRSWPRSVRGKIARAAKVGHLMLVHINPLATAADPVGLPAARAIFPRTDLGHDRLVVEF